MRMDEVAIEKNISNEQIKNFLLRKGYIFLEKSNDNITELGKKVGLKNIEFLGENHIIFNRKIIKELHNDIIMNKKYYEKKTNKSYKKEESKFLIYFSGIVIILILYFMLYKK
jgi:hypothetical protein